MFDQSWIALLRHGTYTPAYMKMYIYASPYAFSQAKPEGHTSGQPVLQ
jgi:hypothetical protein